MGRKVLLADDSLTIQKVIKITLANEPYEIDICPKEEELESKLKSSAYDLVLLDFSFSEEADGYELAQKIRSLASRASIIMLYGTFDTIDENRLESSGVSGKIVKPFDSTKFVGLCRDVLSVSDVTPSTQEIDSSASSESPEGWVVQETTSHTALETNVSQEKSKAEQASQMKSELEGWGVEMPQVIGTKASDQEVERPSIIESEKDVSSKIEKGSSSYEEIRNRILTESKRDADNGFGFDEISTESKNSDETQPGYTLPSQEDLEYPDPKEDRPQLTPLTELKPEKGKTEDIFEDDATGDLELEEQVYDEELSEDFWAIDDDQSPEMEGPSKEVGPSTSPLESEVKSKIAERLEVELKQHLEGIVEQMVKQYCKETVEKVAWELMPDLAENLIKQELNKISESVLND